MSRASVLTLARPHHLPPSLTKTHLEYHALRHWSNLLTIGKPLLIGSLVCSAPFAVLSYGFTKRLVARHQREKHLHDMAAGKEEAESSRGD